MLKAVTGGGGGAGTVTSVAGTSNRITTTGTTDVVVDIAATYVGQSSITTLGTITTGVWNAGTVKGLTLTSAAIGFTIAGGTTSKTLTVPLDATVSGTNTGDQTTSGTSNRITVSTGSTNPVIDISSSYIGQNTITTLGTIATGVWNGGAVASTGAVSGTNLSGTNTGDQTTAGTSNRITVTNGSTSPVIDISSSYVGQATITTLGTITTGVWNAGAVTSSGNINYVGQSYNAPQTLTDQATVAWSMNSGGVAVLTLGASRTMGAPTNIQAGGTYCLEIIQGGAGSFVITWNSVFKWPGGVAPTLTTTVGAKDVITFISFDGTNLFGVSQLNFS